MKKTLQELFKDYIENPSLETQDPIAKYYVISKEDRKKVEEDIKVFLRQDLPEGGISWYNFFEGNMKFWQEVYLIKQEKTAQKCYERALRNKEEPFLVKSSMYMCDSACENTRDIKGLDKKIEEVWIKTFKDFPEFKSLLDNYRQEKEEDLKKYLESLNLPKKEIPETIKKLEIVVPIICEVENQIETEKNIRMNLFEEVKQTEEYQEFMANRVEYFNEFQLQGYIEMPECHSIQMRVENNNNIFTLELNKPLDEEKLKDELLGQLSDGLGENLSQQSVIIGNHKYYFDFDIDKASNFMEIKEQKKKKIK